MSLSTSRLAYTDVFDALDRAKLDPYGLRIRLESENACIHLRMRINQARSIDRDDNKAVFEANHPMYGRSVYDELVCRYRLIDNAWYLYVEKARIRGEMESLSDVPGYDLPFEPQPQIEYLPPEPEAIEAPRPMLQIEHIKRRL